MDPFLRRENAIWKFEFDYWVRSNAKEKYLATGQRSFTAFLGPSNFIAFREEIYYRKWSFERQKLWLLIAVGGEFSIILSKGTINFQVEPVFFSLLFAIKRKEEGDSIFFYIQTAVII